MGRGKCVKEMKISSLLPTIDQFKVKYADTLFNPYWPNLKEGKCPLCGLKLQQPSHGKTLFCRGKKHKTFVIKQQVYKGLGGKDLTPPYFRSVS